MRAHGAAVNRLLLIDDFLCISAGIVRQIFQRVCAPQDQVQVLVSSVQIVARVSVRRDEVIFPVRVPVDVRVRAVADERGGILRLLYCAGKSVPDNRAFLAHPVRVGYRDPPRQFGCARRPRDLLYCRYIHRLWCAVPILQEFKGRQGEFAAAGIMRQKFRRYRKHTLGKRN